MQSGGGCQVCRGAKFEEGEADVSYFDLAIYSLEPDAGNVAYMRLFVFLVTLACPFCRKTSSWRLQIVPIILS